MNNQKIRYCGLGWEYCNRDCIRCSKLNMIISSIPFNKKNKNKIILKNNITEDKKYESAKYQRKNC